MKIWLYWMVTCIAYRSFDGLVLTVNTWSGFKYSGRWTKFLFRVTVTGIFRVFHRVCEHIARWSEPQGWDTVMNLKQ
jgi:hypothetical protein